MLVTILNKLTEVELSQMIRDANKLYYSEEEPLMTDNEYDVLISYMKERFPKNNVVNEGHTLLQKSKVLLPYEMWSMDKIKPDTDALKKWMTTYQGSYILSCKLDGISALYTTEGSVPKLYTRGNGRTGQDISHLIPFLWLPKTKNLTLRGEIIIEKAVFLEKYAKNFANARNFVAGVVNKKTEDPKKY